MLEDEFVTADELFAAGATFTLVAWAFAYVYVVCQALLPGSFGALAGSGNPRTWMELLFLSFTTLSGVGLGDIVPLLPMARALVMLEEFSGVMYLALVVSRLIALSVRSERCGESMLHEDLLIQRKGELHGRILHFIRSNRAHHADVP